MSMAKEELDLSQLSKDQQGAVKQFIEVTSEDELVAMLVLRKWSWNAEVAITQYCNGPAGRGGSPLSFTSGEILTVRNPEPTDSTEARPASRDDSPLSPTSGGGLKVRNYLDFGEPLQRMPPTTTAADNSIEDYWGTDLNYEIDPNDDDPEELYTTPEQEEDRQKRRIAWVAAKERKKKALDAKAQKEETEPQAELVPDSQAQPASEQAPGDTAEPFNTSEPTQRDADGNEEPTLEQAQERTAASTNPMPIRTLPNGEPMPPGCQQSIM